jgi:hypothetical protein
MQQWPSLEYHLMDRGMSLENLLARFIDYVQEATGGDRFTRSRLPGLDKRPEEMLASDWNKLDFHRPVPLQMSTHQSSGFSSWRRAPFGRRHMLDNEMHDSLHQRPTGFVRRANSLDSNIDEALPETISLRRTARGGRTCRYTR